jgi:hypothetical protein
VQGDVNKYIIDLSLKALSLPRAPPPTARHRRSLLPSSIASLCRRIVVVDADDDVDADTEIQFVDFRTLGSNDVVKQNNVRYIPFPPATNVDADDDGDAEVDIANFENTTAGKEPFLTKALLADADDALFLHAFRAPQAHVDATSSASNPRLADADDALHTLRTQQARVDATSSDINPRLVDADNAYVLKARLADATDASFSHTLRTPQARRRRRRQQWLSVKYATTPCPRFISADGDENDNGDDVGGGIGDVDMMNNNDSAFMLPFTPTTTVASAWEQSLSSTHTYR